MPAAPATAAARRARRFGFGGFRGLTGFGDFATFGYAVLARRPNRPRRATDEEATGASPVRGGGVTTRPAEPAAPATPAAAATGSTEVTACPVARAVALPSERSATVTGDAVIGSGAATATGATGGTAAALTSRSSSRRSAALWWRAFGSVSRARAITRSSSVVGSPSPPVGRSPVRSSVSTTPREYTSLRASAGSPATCSGER